MKTKEQLSEDYALENFKEFGWHGRRLVASNSFIAGYEAAQPRWVKANDGLPPQNKGVCVFTKTGETIIGYLDSDNVWTMSETGYIRTVIAWCDCIPNFKSETT